MALEDILRAQDLRDAQDRERPMGALRPAEDAFVIESDGMTSGQVLERALEIVEQTSKAPRVSDCS